MREGRGRAPCCAKVGLNKGPWMPEEDTRLVAYVNKYGHANWRALPRLAGLARCGKSCRLRWINYLRPDIKRGNFSKEEEDAIIKLHALLGNKWSKIASRLPGRTDNEIKNVWNTYLKKRVTPKEQKSTEEPLSSASSITTVSLSCSNEGESKIEVVQKEKNNFKTKMVVDEPNSGMWVIHQDPPKTSPRASPLDAGVKDDGDLLFALPDIAAEPSEIWNTPSCTSASDVELKDSDEHLFDLPEITVEPSEIWNMIDGAGDQDTTTFKAESNGGNANDAWLAYLEKELDLSEEECNNCMLMEGGDPIASYFQGQQSSPFPFLSFNFN